MRPQSLLRAWACDFCAGFGIVAPMLALWSVGQGLGQVQDRAILRDNSAVPALVVTADPVGGRGSSPSSVLLAFQPSSMAPVCRVAIPPDRSPLSVEPGQTLSVVPRSADCEAPLIPSRIGDPVRTFALAAALLIGSVAALKVWAGLSRPRSRRAALS